MAAVDGNELVVALRLTPEVLVILFLRVLFLMEALALVAVPAVAVAIALMYKRQ